MSLKTGEILNIRKATPDDAIEIINYADKVSRESDNISYGPGEFRMTIEQEQNYIKSLKDSKNCIMILGLIKKQIVSVASLTGGKRKRREHLASLGITVRKPFWRQGIGREMSKFLINWAQQSNFIRKINLSVRIDNIGAIELYKQLGFNEVGILTRVLKINEEFYDALMMGLNID